VVVAAHVVIAARSVVVSARSVVVAAFVIERDRSDAAEVIAATERRRTVSEHRHR
jgi:hypothetical protein